jgi:hypothetical protein
MQNIVRFPQANEKAVAQKLTEPSYVQLAETEYTASQIRKLLQQLFPHRKLVLSQFTFFCHAGVSSPSGEQVKRGRRCFKLPDILPMAALLGVKEEGIPYKNVEGLPQLVRENSERIFQSGPGVLLSGYSEKLSLIFPGDTWQGSAVDDFLNHEITAPGEEKLFWSYDVGELARQLLVVAHEEKRFLRAA